MANLQWPGVHQHVQQSNRALSSFVLLVDVFSNAMKLSNNAIRTFLHAIPLEVSGSTAAAAAELY